jgi:isocitrate dehydrogenase
VQLDVVAQGVRLMARDLAVLIGPDQKWLNTQDVLAKLDENLKNAMR